MQFKGTEGGWETTLHEDDWCHIVLADTIGGAMFVRRGPQGQKTQIPEGGCILEYTIRARPPLKTGKTLTKRYRVGFTENRHALRAARFDRTVE
jgi:hypothetical protein